MLRREAPAAPVVDDERVHALEAGKRVDRDDGNAELHDVGHHLGLNVPHDEHALDVLLTNDSGQILVRAIRGLGVREEEVVVAFDCLLDRALDDERVELVRDGVVVLVEDQADVVDTLARKARGRGARVIVELTRGLEHARAYGGADRLVRVVVQDNETVAVETEASLATSLMVARLRPSMRPGYITLPHGRQPTNSAGREPLRGLRLERPSERLERGRDAPERRLSLSGRGSVAGIAPQASGQQLRDSPWSRSCAPSAPACGPAVVRQVRVQDRRLVFPVEQGLGRQHLEGEAARTHRCRRRGRGRLVGRRPRRAPPARSTRACRSPAGAGVPLRPKSTSTGVSPSRRMTFDGLTSRWPTPTRVHGFEARRGCRRGTRSARVDVERAAADQAIEREPSDQLHHQDRLGPRAPESKVTKRARFACSGSESSAPASSRNSCRNSCSDRLRAVVGS